MLLAIIVLLPVNASGGTLFFLRKELVTSNIDKVSISNVRPKSLRFFAHIGMEYVLTFWTCFLLYKEYDRVASMRLLFMASRQRRVEQYTVLVRNVPRASDRSISDSVNQLFKKNHRSTYICHQVLFNANKFAKFVKERERIQNWLDYNQLKLERNANKRPTSRTRFLGLWGQKVDSINFYKDQLAHLDRKLTMERQRILKDPKSVMPAAFVSFKSRWGANVCAQTQQSKNPTYTRIRKTGNRSYAVMLTHLPWQRRRRWEISDSSTMQGGSSDIGYGLKYQIHRGCKADLRHWLRSQITMEKIDFWRVCLSLEHST